MWIENERKYLVNQASYKRSVNNYRKLFHYKRNYLVAKRIFDIAFSLMVFVSVMIWLLPILALLIKLTSRGPVFFVQKRVGFMGKTFYCYKFRTMKVNAMADKMAAKEKDSRITKIGHFLRKSNLDELPQFFNVFLGNMSVVGPRPHMPADCKKFSKSIERYKYRNLVKPGITGLAQVKGFRGPVETFDQIFHRYQYDAFYVRNSNFWLDVRIIRQTAAQTLFFILGKLTGRDTLGEEIRKRKIYRKITFSFKQLLSRA